MKKWLYSVVGLTVAATFVGVVFQNCGQAGFDANDQVNGTSLSSTGTFANAPFPYEISPNVIAYMSCPTVSSSTDLDSFFSFKLLGTRNEEYNTYVSEMNGGNYYLAYPVLPSLASGGARLNSNFISYMSNIQKNLSTGTSTEATIANIQSAIQTNTPYQYAHMQMSFRDKTYLRDPSSVQVYPYSPQGGGATPTLATAWMLDLFQAPLVSQALANGAISLDGNGNMPWISEYPYLAAGPMNYGASMAYAYGDSDAHMEQVRSIIENGNILLTSVYVNDNPNLLTTGSTTVNVGGYAAGSAGIYGMGYHLTFGVPQPAIYAYNNLVNVLGVSPTNQENNNPNEPGNGSPTKPSNALLTVQEYDLSSLQPTNSTWGCVQYAIVRPEDSSYMCPNEDPFNVARRDELDLVRKVLHAENWNVNTTLRCVSPTSNIANFSCYRSMAAGQTAPINEIGAWANMQSIVSQDAALAAQNSNITNAFQVQYKAGNNTALLTTPFGMGFEYYFAPGVVNGSGQSLAGQPYTTLQDPTFGQGNGGPGIEYRYWWHNCGGTFRECVNFVSVCFKAQ